MKDENLGSVNLLSPVIGSNVTVPSHTSEMHSIQHCKAITGRRPRNSTSTWIYLKYNLSSQVFYLNTTCIVCEKYGSLCNSNRISRREKNTNQAYVILSDALILQIVKVWWIKTANRLTTFTKLHGMFLGWKSAISNSGEQQILFGQTF